jgi:uncharacterized protein (TIGR03086 family)
MTLPDLEAATRCMADIIAGIPDGTLDGPTPCPEYSVGDLVDHVEGATFAFTMAARKEALDEVGSQRPSGDASRLGDDWRTRIPPQLDALAEAWRASDAWTGMTKAGGVDLPGDMAGLIALDELVVHGWDLAKATGQAYDVDESTLEAVHGFVAQFCGPGREGARGGLFGPEVDVPADAPLLDRVIGMTGRDPAWSPR